MLELLLAYSRCSHWLYFSVITCVNGVPDCALCVKFPPLKKKSRLQALYPPDSFMGRIATDDVSAPDVLFWLTMIPLIIFKMCSIWNVSKMKIA